MESTFQCDNCGNEFPLAQMKEVFSEEGTDRTKQRLCPNCLDQKMNEANEVKGVVGEEKRAAVRLVDEPNSSDEHKKRESLGQRPA